MRVLQTLALPLGHVTIFGATVAAPFGAADEARTRYLHLGKVALYQMSYGRILHVACRGFAPGDVGYYTAPPPLCQPQIFKNSYFLQNRPNIVKQILHTRSRPLGKFQLSGPRHKQNSIAFPYKKGYNKKVKKLHVFRVFCASRAGRRIFMPRFCQKKELTQCTRSLKKSR